LVVLYLIFILTQKQAAAATTFEAAGE